MSRFPLLLLAALPMLPQAPSPYSLWLNEDVAYIIEDPERAAFERLASDPERAKFIEQFWLRRDPTPATPANEAKEEHYRRIAYANKRFSRPSGIPGWRTDRGYLYILYGPPDEIESHPKSAGRPAREMWRYHGIDGLGRNLFLAFVDRQGFGDYRIAPVEAGLMPPAGR